VRGVRGRLAHRDICGVPRNVPVCHVGKSLVRLEKLETELVIVFVETVVLVALPSPLIVHVSAIEARTVQTITSSTMKLVNVKSVRNKPVSHSTNGMLRNVSVSDVRHVSLDFQRVKVANVLQFAR
jgi:hypothetical protein